MPASFCGRRDPSVIFARDQLRQSANAPCQQTHHVKATLPGNATASLCLFVLRPQYRGASSRLLDLSSQHQGPYTSKRTCQSQHRSSILLSTRKQRFQTRASTLPGLRRFQQRDTGLISATTRPKTQRTGTQQHHNSNGNQRRIKTALAANGATDTGHECAQR